MLYRHTRHMGYVWLHRTKELMKNHILRERETQCSKPSSIQWVCFNRIFTRFCTASASERESTFIVYEPHSLVGWIHQRRNKKKQLELSTRERARNSTSVCAFLLHFIEIFFAFDKIAFVFLSKFNLHELLTVYLKFFLPVNRTKNFCANKLFIAKSFVSVH